MHKLYYSISEASQIADEEQHILRYWEKEFEQLKPKKNRGGNRIYSEKDIYVILTIKKLLRDSKLSIKGAKDQLKNMEFDIPENGYSIPDRPAAYAASPANQTTEQVSALSAVAPTVSVMTKEEAREIYNLLNDVLTFLKNS